MYQSLVGQELVETAELHMGRDIDVRLQEIDRPVRLSQTFKQNTRGGNLWPIFKGAVETKDWVNADRISDEITEVLHGSSLSLDVKTDLLQLIQRIRQRANMVRAAHSDRSDSISVDDEQGPEDQTVRKRHTLASSAERSLEWFVETTKTLCKEISTGRFMDDDSFLQEPETQTASVSLLLAKIRDAARATIHERDNIERELVLWFRLCATRLDEVVKEGHVQNRGALEMPDTPAISIPQPQMENLERARSTLTSVLCKLDSVLSHRVAYPHRINPTQEQYAEFVVEYEKKKSEMQRQVRFLRDENEKYQREINSLQQRLNTKTDGRTARGPENMVTKSNLKILELEQHVEDLQKELREERWRNQTLQPDNTQKEFAALTGSYEDKITTIKKDLTSMTTDHKKVGHMVTTSQSTLRILTGSRNEEDSSSVRRGEAAAEMRIRELEGRIEDLNYRLQSNTALLARAEEEKDFIKTRLSRLLGSQLQTNNPELTDLGDDIRPIKIGEWYNELYDNQWKDAFQSLVEVHKLDELLAIQRLLEILQDCYAFCEQEEANQLKTIVSTMLIDSGLTRHSDIEIPKLEIVEQMKMLLKNTRKQISTRCIKKKFIEQRKNIAASESEFSSCLPYVRRCLELCWFMVIHSPPVWLESHCDHRINADVFRFYTKTGSLLDYIVWPALFLTKGGKLLSKGAAQPM